jgi:lipopolysaccharide transport system ATP-binding protein
MVMFMPDDIAIRVRGLGKKYRIGGPQEQYHTFRDAIVNSVKAPFRKLAPRSADQSTNEFWAIRDVSFDVHKGDVMGIIGRNGAGKSTLLKILSRITTPTEGEVDMYGRVGSLLEVGTGFHPELTGRDNIFLSGSILGMRKREIEEKFNEIVTFAEIQKFIDTPVKRYSSGMYVRLAFAVAAHLEPEILVVDEVLAVGDAGFQKKCLGKMDEVAKEGRTVLFVSHNMAAVQNLCVQGILMDKGKIVDGGDTQKVIKAYNDSMQLSFTNNDLMHRKDRTGSGEIKFNQISLKNGKFEPVKLLFSGQTCYIEINYASLNGKKYSNVTFGLSIYSHGAHLFSVSTDFVGKEIIKIEKNGKIYCKIDEFPLSPGIYTYNAICRIGGGISDWIINAGEITVEGGDFFGTGHLPPISHQGILISHKWLIDSEIVIDTK